MTAIIPVSYLGNLEKLLGNVNDTLELLDVLNALLDSIGMLSSSSIQAICVLLDLTLGEGRPGRPTELGNAVEDGQQTEGDDGLLVQDIELVADGGNGCTGGTGENSGLGDEGVAGDGVDDGAGALLNGGRSVGVGSGARELKGLGERGQSSAGGNERRPSGGDTWNQ